MHTHDGWGDSPVIRMSTNQMMHIFSRLTENIHWLRWQSESWPSRLPFLLEKAEHDSEHDDNNINIHWYLLNAYNYWWAWGHLPILFYFTNQSIRIAFSPSSSGWGIVTLKFSKLFFPSSFFPQKAVLLKGSSRVKGIFFGLCLLVVSESTVCWNWVPSLSFQGASHAVRPRGNTRSTPRPAFPASHTPSSLHAHGGVSGPWVFSTNSALV